MGTIRLLLADDQKTFVESLRFVLEAKASDIEVVGVCHDGAEVLERIEELAPDVVFLDVRMPRLDGVEAVKAIHARHPDIAVIMLTSFDDDQYVQQAVLHGASGYLLKDLAPEDLIEAVRAVKRGTVLFSPSVAHKLVQHMDTHACEGGRGEPPAWETSLSAREKEILRLIAQGLANKEIGDRLNLSEQTVKNYVSVIYAKIGVRNRWEAASKARDM